MPSAERPHDAPVDAPDPRFERTVAGVRCGEVLAELSDFLDGALPPARVAALQAHVAECHACARYGADVADALARLRAGLAEPPALAGAVAERLRVQLRARLAAVAGPS